MCGVSCNSQTQLEFVKMYYICLIYNHDMYHLFLQTLEEKVKQVKNLNELI